MAQTILYYPTINIQDSAWLRNAVLYWDEVSSIVPYEDYPNFSPEVLFLQRSGVEMSRNVQSGNTQNLKSAERRKTAAASDQAAVCACAHSRYFAGGSPSGLRV